MSRVAAQFHNARQFLRSRRDVEIGLVLET